MPLERLFLTLREVLFGFEKSSCPYRGGPPELFETIDFGTLWLQYLRLRQFIITLMAQRSVFYNSVCEVVSVVIAFKDGVPVEVPVSSVELESARTVSSEGGEFEFVHWKGHGEAKLLQRQRRLQDLRRHFVFATVDIV